MKLVNISMVGDLTNALKENADTLDFEEESVEKLPLISITKPEGWQVVALILVGYVFLDLTWLFCEISDKKPTEQDTLLQKPVQKMEGKENYKESKKWERVKSIHQVGTRNN